MKPGTDYVVVARRETIAVPFDKLAEALQSPEMVASGNGAAPFAAAVSVADQLPLSHQGFNLDRPLREARDGFEKAYFEFHLAREGGSMTRVAEKTGLERTHLYRKLRQLGVDLGRNKRNG